MNCDVECLDTDCVCMMMMVMVMMHHDGMMIIG